VIAREIKDRDGEGTALNNLGFTFLKAGNPTEAEKMLVNAIQAWESMRQMLGSNDANKVSIFEEQARTYRTLQQVRVAQNNPIAALEIAERGRARAFVDLLTQRLSTGDASSVIASAPNLDQIQQIAKSQKATLVQYSIIYDDFQIQGKRQSRESALYIWVIQPTGEITFRQVDLQPLWQKHNASLASLIVGNQEFLAVRSRSSLGSTQPQPDLPTLHQLLIEPILSLLPKDPNAHVIFIPQRSLFQVPFPALQDANGTYLIQKHTILTAPSIQVLDLTRQQRQKLAQKPGNSSNALVLGNPTMPSVSAYLGAPKQQLSPLPGAEAEAIAIAPLLNTQAITGAQGTKAEIVQKMPQASIIHLATHGLLDDVRGLGSAIAMAPSGKDDGLLTAEEIFDMKLQASLVVLSACNTGEGRITGDGVIGLSRALISAGVPSVIVSLWAVPDAPTSELMQSFYQNLQNNPDKAQALRQAMLTTMKTHPQPRNWAAFTLIGEAE
jgi:CHAT domain-containing protein